MLDPTNSSYGPLLGTFCKFTFRVGDFSFCNPVMMTGLVTYSGCAKLFVFACV